MGLIAYVIGTIVILVIAKMIDRGLERSRQAKVDAYKAGKVDAYIEMDRANAAKSLYK